MRTVTRRTALKQGSVIGSVGIAGLLAGCTGDIGDGGSGNGGSSGSGGQDLEEVTYVQPPWGPWVLINAIAEDEGYWDEEFNEAGYSINVQETWEDATIFASGQADWVPIGSAEAAQLAEETGTDITVFAEQSWAPHGYFVEAGGQYDPAETGSVQSSLDMIVEDEAQFAIGSWAAGSLAYGSYAIDDQFGYRLEEEGDFNAITVDYAAMPELFRQGDIQVFSNSAIHGAAGLLNEGEITPLWWDMNLFNDNYGFIPSLNNMLARTPFAEEHTEALRAMLRVYKRSATDIVDNIDEVAQSETALESLPVENEEESRFALGMLFLGEGEYVQPAIAEDPEMTPEVEERNKEWMDVATEVGMLEPGWEEVLHYEHIEADV